MTTSLVDRTGQGCAPQADAARPAAPAATVGVKWRQIREEDLPTVAELLSRGFRLRPKAYWLRGLQRQVARALPANCPRYGYVLTDQGRPVGAILMVSSTLDTGAGAVTRCNLSSWYVDPGYRNFASLLVTSVTKKKDVTYFNISPAPHTWKTVEAQGFAPYCLGEMTTVPALAVPHAGTSVTRVTSDPGDLPADEAEILIEHARFGCLSLVVACDGRHYPFVFQKYRIAKRLMPCWRLIYCRDVADFARFAGNLGRVLLLHGRPIVVVDANGPIPGLVGRYSEARGRKYAKGPHVPRLGDLAYTEGVFFN